jgi:hypothetical protein
MTTSGSAATTEPTPETLSLIYNEVEVQLDKQFEQIDSLNARAQQLMGFAAGVLAIFVGLRPPTDNGAVSAMYVGAIVIFAILVYKGYEAWRIVGWRRDPQPEALWRKYRLWPDGWLRQQIIWNWIASGDENQAAIDKKVSALRTTQLLLAIEVGYLVLTLILRPYIE